MSVQGVFDFKTETARPCAADVQHEFMAGHITKRKLVPSVRVVVQIGKKRNGSFLVDLFKVDFNVKLLSFADPEEIGTTERKGPFDCPWCANSGRAYRQRRNYGFS